MKGVILRFQTEKPEKKFSLRVLTIILDSVNASRKKIDKNCEGFFANCKALKERGAERTQVREHRSESEKVTRRSRKEHKADALALGADEGRDKLR